MEYEKIRNLLDSTSNQQSKLEQKIGLKLMMTEEEHTLLINKLILNTNTKVQFI